MFLSKKVEPDDLSLQVWGRELSIREESDLLPVFGTELGYRLSSLSGIRVFQHTSRKGVFWLHTVDDVRLSRTGADDVLLEAGTHRCFARKKKKVILDEPIPTAATCDSKVRAFICPPSFVFKDGAGDCLDMGIFTDLPGILPIGTNIEIPMPDYWENDPLVLNIHKYCFFSGLLTVECVSDSDNPDEYIKFSDDYETTVPELLADGWFKQAEIINPFL